MHRESHTRDLTNTVLGITVLRVRAFVADFALLSVVIDGRFCAPGQQFCEPDDQVLWSTNRTVGARQQRVRKCMDVLHWMANGSRNTALTHEAPSRNPERHAYGRNLGYTRRQGIWTQDPFVIHACPIGRFAWHLTWWHWPPWFLNCFSQIKCDGLTERIDFSKLHIWITLVRSNGTASLRGLTLVSCTISFIDHVKLASWGSVRIALLYGKVRTCSLMGWLKPSPLVLYRSCNLWSHIR